MLEDSELFRRLYVCGRAVALATVVLVASCAVSPSPQTGEADSAASGLSPLARTEWTLVSFEGAGELTPFDSWLRFDAGGRVSASGGCNSYTGSYDAGDENLTIGPHLAGTLMACEPHITDPETLYIEALQMAAGYRLSGDELVIQLRNGGRLAFTRR